MLPSASVPSFGSKGASFSDYEQQVKMRQDATTTVLGRRASALILHMDVVARRVRMAAGGDVTMGQEGAGEISAVLPGFMAPDVVDSVYQEVVRTWCSAVCFAANWNPMCTWGGGGVAFPEILASAMRMWDAPLSRSQKPLALGSV